MHNMPIANVSIVAAVRRMWQRVLQRDHIGPEENFFQLGGNRPLADLLFEEIERILGRAIPSGAIDYAPTIESLSALLDSAEPLSYSPLVLMKRGCAESPALFVHSVAGSIGELYNLASHVEIPNEIYGIEAQGVLGLAEPLSSVEDMAARYLESLRQLDRKGPYTLIGYSFGGLIALEMAQQLMVSGERVALLMMLDTNLHPRYLPWSQRLRLFARRTRHHIQNVRQLPIVSRPSYFTGKVRKRMSGVQGLGGIGIDAVGTRPQSFAATTSRIMKNAYIARAAYRPRFYDGMLRYVLAETETYYLPHDPHAVWSRWVAEMKIETAPGDHMALIRSSSQAVGGILARHIRQALSRA